MQQDDEKRKRGERLGTGIVKEEIIKCVLDHGGSLEEPEIRDFLAKKVNIGRGGSRTAKEHLKDLKKKGIFTKIEEKGYANVWSIKEDLKAIAIIHKDYPGLSSNLQQSDFILDYVAEKHRSLFPYYGKLKEMLRSSPTFFELCLLPKKTLKKRLHDTFKFLPEESQIANKGSFYTIQYFFFVWCTRQDIIKGIFTEDALRLIKNETASHMSNLGLANSYLVAARAKKRAVELIENDEEAKEDIERWKEVIKSKITLQDE